MVIVWLGAQLCPLPPASYGHGNSANLAFWLQWNHKTQCYSWRSEGNIVLCAQWSNKVSYRTLCRRGTHVEAFFWSLLAIPQATYYILGRKIPHMCTGRGGVSNQISHLIGFRNRPSVDQICISHGHLHLNWTALLNKAVLSLCAGFTREQIKDTSTLARGNAACAIGDPKQ